MSARDLKNGQDELEDAVPVAKVWPEVERAECLARGAALKWASCVFCRPEHLERLSQYRKRESQRTSSIHTRLKSMVQSYLEGVGWGLEQLREARFELREVSHTLKKAGLESSRNAEGVKSLERLREVFVSHRQLLAAVSNLPRLYSVRSMVLETERLVESRRLLEAHAHLMDLEHWQDDILWQLHGAAGTAGSTLSAEDQELVAKYFSGVGQLVDALGKELWAVVSSALALARQNPTPFVSAVRIVEREEALDRALLEERGGTRGTSRPLPPGRPRCWRACFFQVLEEAVSARFRSISYLHTRGPGLAGHLSALQHGIIADLATVRHLLEHCVPPHYRLTGAYLRASQRCLHAHLAQVSSWDLESGEIFAVLNWVLHIYNSPDMMGHPELVTEMEKVELEPLISTEGLEQLQNKYVQSVRKCVSEWMHKALQVELQDWQRDQEPDTDHEGFYQTSLPTIITQVSRSSGGIWERASQGSEQQQKQVLLPLSAGIHQQLHHPQKIHRESAEAAVVPLGGTVLSDSSKPPGSAGPGGETGVLPGDGSAPAGPPALPPGPADPILAGPGRPHPQTLPRPRAPPGDARPRSTTLQTASAGGGPVADGGGVRQGSDAEEAGVSQRRGEEAARAADGSGRPAV
ncbi:exocyst complex component 3-like protein isoform X2 [Anarrhichthys ocellatus]|uniref:exocyst complex component 3-like protein isoform X2 n=1 Tax=Anarrhichthys ocellatus TaxID=433405 RepID=UPI0012EDC13D|nr:exocyst complex component 3-like protein isoform X2 [Anarrhichthys ocellatus]